MYKKTPTLFYPLPAHALAVLWILCLFAFRGSAQTTIGRLNELSLEKDVPFTVTQFSTKDGLLQSQVADIVKGDDGSLLLSTANGSCSFNGYEFKELPIDKSYRRHFFDRLYHSDKYGILYGKDFTTSRIVQLQPTYKLLSGDDYKFHLAASENDSLVLSDFKNELYLAVLPDFHITPLHCRVPEQTAQLYFHNNVVYSTAKDGLYACDLQTRATKKLSDEEIFFLKTNPYDHRIYGLAQTAVYIIGDSMQKLTEYTFSDPAMFCRSIAFMSPGQFCVATDDGLYMHYPTHTQHITVKDGLTSESILSLYYDKPGNCLFAGTPEKGLLKLKFKTAFTYYKKEGLTETSFNSIIRTADGRVLLGDNNCCIHELKHDTIMKYNNMQNSYACITEIDGTLYCGTWGGGIQIIKDNKLLQNIIPPALPGIVVYAVYRDKQKNIWVGTNNGISKGTSAATLKPALPQIRSKINCIYELRNGSICLGGENGFYIVSPDGAVKAVGKAEGLISKEVRAFMEDEEGKLWIGTYGSGIYCYEKGKLTSINGMKNCMLFEDAFCLAVDHFGELYMTSNYGLWHLPFKALDNFYKHKTDYLVPGHYTQENGIMNTEFNGGFQNNYLHTEELTAIDGSPLKPYDNRIRRQEHLYFPSIEGIVALTPDTPRVQQLMPQIALTIQDSSLSSPDHVFARDVSVINFKASCVNFSDQYNVYFQYKVLRNGDTDDEWSVPQKESNFSFYQLSPGDYTFMIRAIDAGNDPQPVEKTFSFHIKPYFYETDLFRIFIVLIVLLATVLIIRWLVKENRERIEKENNTKRQLAELQLEGVQAQMNPHFVFNCLNTIQALFITGEIKQANEYTSKFSSLMRLIIEHIRKRTISIREEVELLEIYLPLENIQMEIPFEFSITVAPDINSDTTLIHGMIIHTFVENAIKHGVKPLQKQGKLSVNFKKENDSIVVEIRDNGNGIKRSAKKQDDGKHISRGLQIIKERINIINLLENINIYTETVDLQDLDPAQTGTLVKIIYPIQYDTNTDR